MLLHTKTHLKCELPVISHSHSRNHLLSSRTTWRLSHFPVFTDSRNLKVLSKQYSTESLDHLFSPTEHLLVIVIGYGFSYARMSSRVIKKAENNVDLQNNMRERSLSCSYEAAMEALSSLITRQKRTDRTPVRGKYGKLERMSEYLKILSMEEKIDKLKIIHVAGTKGKGSTCAFCEAILRECGFRTGLFTSPHLIDVRERFRLNGDDISEDKFLQYFWDCWNQLKEKVSDDLPMPPLFQFLTILAFKVFICEQVDVAIIEVGLGGTRDSTNVIEKPIVCGIASLGMDHTETLGDTLGKIASHKAGIFKPEIPAYTVPQLAEAMKVLEERASELTVPLTIASPLDPQRLEGLKLGLSGEHQFTNAGLAVLLCKCWLQKTGNWDHLIGTGVNKDEVEIPEAFRRGLSTARLSGRAQIVHDTHLKHYSSTQALENVGGELIFYLDGAHSPESMEVCAKWFSSATKENKISTGSRSSEVQHMKFFQGNGHIPNGRAYDESNKRSKQILLFNCMEVRDPQILLPRLVDICALSGTHFSKALFVPSMSTYNKVTSGASVIPSEVPTKDLSWQFNLQRIWEKIIHGKDAGSEKMDRTVVLPPNEFLHEDVSHCNGEKHFSSADVIPSLPLTIKWLRDCAKQNPSLRLQVLVTGSLHLVGDVLKLLKR